MFQGTTQWAILVTDGLRIDLWANLRWIILRWAILRWAILRWAILWAISSLASCPSTASEHSVAIPGGKIANSVLRPTAFIACIHNHHPIQLLEHPSLPPKLLCPNSLWQSQIGLCPVGSAHRVHGTHSIYGLLPI